MRGGGTKIAKWRCLFLRGGVGGYIAGMPMVADGRGVGVKNRADVLNGWSQREIQKLCY